MSSIEVSSFRKLYIIFAFIFASLLLGFIGSIIFFYSISKSIVLTISLLFALCIVLLVIVFMYLLRKKLVEIVKTLDNIIEAAMNGNERITDYDETILSALENKLFRFISMTKANMDTIENERNKIKTLVSDISHQTKTPLSNILLFNELLLENNSIDENANMIAQDIKVQSQKLNWLIQSLVKISRLETGIIVANREQTQVRDTILKTVEQVFKNAEKKNININVSCDEKINAYYDSKWTGEAIVNILENAIKYTPEDGNINIVVTPYEFFTRIDIGDTGMGIEESEINNIFKRFYRCKNARYHEGVGIGLYLAREIISSQGGYIKVSSKLGQGSTFSVFISSKCI